MPNKTRPSALESRPSSIEKAIDILFCFDPQHVQLRLTDISQRLGLHKSTTHRLLSLLKKKRLITADATSQLYSLGPGVVELAWIILRQQDLRTVCYPYLERLRQATNETVSLYIRMGDRRVCIEELESGQEIKYSQTVGLAAPCTLGPRKSAAGVPAAWGTRGAAGHPAADCPDAQYAHGPPATPGGTGHGAPAWLCGERRRTLALGLRGGCPHSGLERQTHRRHQCARSLAPSHQRGVARSGRAGAAGGPGDLESLWVQSGPCAAAC